MKAINSGWGDAKGILPEILDAIGWKEYIDTASKPYPVHCLDTEANRKANEARIERGLNDIPTMG